MSKQEKPCSGRRESIINSIVAQAKSNLERLRKDFTPEDERKLRENLGKMSDEKLSKLYAGYTAANIIARIGY